MRPLELAFPHAIDKLQADEGHRDGEKPVVVDDVPLEASGNNKIVDDFLTYKLYNPNMKIMKIFCDEHVYLLCLYVSLMLKI